MNCHNCQAVPELHMCAEHSDKREEMEHGIYSSALLKYLAIEMPCECSRFSSFHKMLLYLEKCVYVTCLYIQGFKKKHCAF